MAEVTKVSRLIICSVEMLKVISDDFKILLLLNVIYLNSRQFKGELQEFGYA
jgi:hypothetical protein